MYRIARIRMSGIGPADARYDRPGPDSAPFEINCLDADDNPADTLVWLENGGGKTVLLSLMFHVLRPDRAPTIGGDEKRRRGAIDDYLLTDDVGHVVCEWVADDRPNRLITGMVAEKRGSSVNRTWYLLDAKDDSFSLDQLVWDADARRIRSGPYLESVETLARDSGSGRRRTLELFKAQTQKVWLGLLADHDLDPALFEYQTRMNRSEGGATGLFRFSSVPQFLEFFLELTMNPDSLAKLSETLTRVADKVADLPRKEIDLAYCRAATEHLSRLADDWEEHAHAATEARSARHNAELLDDGLAATINGLDDQIAEAARNEAALAEEAQQADRARREAEGVARRLAIGVADAQVALDTAVEGAARAEADAASMRTAAWMHVPNVRRLEGLRGERSELADQLDAATAPIRNRRDLTLRGVRQHLQANAATSREELTAAGAALEAAKEAEDTAIARERAASGQESEARGRKTALEGTLEEVDAALATARSEGILEALERAAQGLERWTATVDTRAAAVEGAAQTLVDAKQAAGEAAGAATAKSTAALAASQAAKSAERHASEGRSVRDSIASRPLVAQLAGVDADLELVGAEVAVRAADLGRQLRADAVTVEAEAAEDRRAARSLADHNLLPPRREAEALCEQLRAAGVRSAFPGWQYLADAVPTAKHEAVIAAHPAVVDGVVVASADLERAATILAAAGPAAAIVIGADALLLDDANPAPATWVVPPDRAMFDASAAPAAAEVRAERLAAVDARKDGLAFREREATALAEALTTHLEAWPQGLLGFAEGEAAQRRAAATEAEAVAASAAEHAARLAAAVETAQQILDAARTAKAEAERTRDRVHRLAEDEFRSDQTNRQIEELRRLILEQAEVAGKAHSDVADARAAQETARRRRGTASEALAGASRELGGLPDPGPGPAADGSFDELRARYVSAAAEFAHATSGSDKALRLATVEAEIARLDQTLAGLEDDLRVMVEDLAATAAAADDAARNQAEALARAQEKRLRNVLVDASAALQLSKNHRKNLPEPDRSVPVLDLPESLEELQALAAEAEKTLEAARARRSAAEEVLAAAKAHVEKANLYRSTVASHQVALSTAVGNRVPRPAAPFVGDVEAAVQEAAAAVTTATAREREAEGRWQRAAQEVTAFARHERWADLTGELPRRLSTDAPDVLAASAGALLEQVRLKADRLADDITKLDTHRQLLLASLGDAVQAAHKSLRSARTKSTLPEGLGDWSHQPFLKLNVDLPSDGAELHSRLRRFANDLIEQSKTGLPTGATLVCRALLACTERDVRVDVLKPNKAQRLQYVPITDMATLSGGMRATAAIAMFCTLARVRAANHGGRVGVGTLILDNPIGDANATYLVTLQRLVAFTSEVQLIYTTGVNDMDAIRLFPVVNRLSNETARRSNLAYVVADPTFLKQLAPADGDAALITGTRLVRRHPAQLTFDAVAAAAAADDSP